MGVSATVPDPKHWRRATVVIVGHGATDEPQAAWSVVGHANALRAQGRFHGVIAGVLNGEPDAEAALGALDVPLVYLVPLFMSDGYFVRRLIPERLRLAGPITVRDGRTLCYCEPVGTHEGLADVIAARLRTACRSHGLALPRTAVVLAGHGSPRDPASAEATRSCAERLAESAEFASVGTAFLEEPPFIAEAAKANAGKPTIFVGFFAADGVHAERDLRHLLGLSPCQAARRRQSGHTLVYTGAIGPDPAVGNLIIERIREADDRHAAAVHAALA